MLNARSIEILNLLEDGATFTVFTVNDLAKKFNISSRAIRYDLENINYILSLHGISTIQKNSDGKLFLYFSQGMLDLILSSSNFNFPEKRVIYLILKLFFENHINLTEEAKILDVTRETLKSHIKEVRLFFEEKNIFLKSFPGKGIFLIGNEPEIRIIFSEYLLNFLKTSNWNNTPFIRKLVERYFYDFNFEDLNSLFKKLDKTHSPKIPSEVYEETICTLLVALKRKKFFEEINLISCPQEKDIYNLAHHINVSFSENECIKLIILLHESKKNKKIYLDKKDEFLLNFKARLKYDINISYESLENIANIEDFAILEKILVEELKKNAKTLLPKKRVALISQNLSFFNKTMKNVLHEWNIDIVETLPPYLYEIYGLEQECDFIITTEKISETLYIPTFKVSFLPYEEELNSLFSYLCFKK